MEKKRPKEVTILVWVLIIVALVAGCGRSDLPLEIAEQLSILDSHNHSQEQFLSIMKALHKNHPNYSLEKIGDGMARTWNGVKEVQKEISMYTVAAELKMLSDDNKGADYAEIMASYMMRKLMKKR